MYFNFFKTTNAQKNYAFESRTIDTTVNTITKNYLQVKSSHFSKIERKRATIKLVFAIGITILACPYLY